MFQKSSLIISALLSALAASVHLDASYSDDMFLGMACAVRRGSPVQDMGRQRVARVSSSRDPVLSSTSRMRDGTLELDHAVIHRTRDHFIEVPDEVYRAPVYVGFSEHQHDDQDHHHDDHEHHDEEHEFEEVHE